MASALKWVAAVAQTMCDKELLQLEHSIVDETGSYVVVYSQANCIQQPSKNCVKLSWSQVLRLAAPCAGRAI